MPSVTIRITDYDLALLNEVVAYTGMSKTAVLLDGLRRVASGARDDSHFTWLSDKEFKAFCEQLENERDDPERKKRLEKILNFKLVWEE